MTSSYKWLATSACLLSSALIAAAPVNPFNQPQENPTPANPSEQWGGEAPYRVSWDNGFFLAGQALVWQSHINGSYTHKFHVVTEEDGSLETHLKKKYPQADWSWGFRLGAGYTMPHDDWELSLEWTRNNMELSDHEHDNDADGTEGLVPFNPNPFSPTAFASKAEANVRIHLNYLDLMLKREFLVTKWLAVKPGLGLRSNWIRARFKAEFEGGNIADRPIVGIEEIHTKFKNNFWGMGPKAELDTRWILGKGFSIVGDLAFSFLYGFFHLEQSSNKPLVTPFIGFEDSANFRQTLPVIDCFLGLRWDRMFDNDKYRLSFNIGWEHHVFFQGLQADLVEAFDVNNSNLTTEGVTFGARFDF